MIGRPRSWATEILHRIQGFADSPLAMLAQPTPWVLEKIQDLFVSLAYVPLVLVLI